MFAVEVAIGAETLRGVANLGMRPTVDGSALVLEVLLFDFDRDIYGQRLTVTFRHKLREEHKFDSLEQLMIDVLADLAVRCVQRRLGLHGAGLHREPGPRERILDLQVGCAVEDRRDRSPAERRRRPAKMRLEHLADVHS